MTLFILLSFITVLYRYESLSCMFKIFRKQKKTTHLVRIKFNVHSDDLLKIISANTEKSQFEIELAKVLGVDLQLLQIQDIFVTQSDGSVVIEVSHAILFKCCDNQDSMIKMNEIYLRSIYLNNNNDFNPVPQISALINNIFNLRNAVHHLCITVDSFSSEPGLTTIQNLKLQSIASLSTTMIQLSPKSQPQTPPMLHPELNKGPGSVVSIIQNLRDTASSVDVYEDDQDIEDMYREVSEEPPMMTRGNTVATVGGECEHTDHEEKTHVSHVIGPGTALGIAVAGGNLKSKSDVEGINDLGVIATQKGIALPTMHCNSRLSAQQEHHDAVVTFVKTNVGQIKGKNDDINTMGSATTDTGDV